MKKQGKVKICVVPVKCTYFPKNMANFKKENNLACLVHADCFFTKATYKCKVRNIFKII